jgi:hypothetical protein
MDLDLEEDDLLGEENDMSDVVRDFVGVRKGHSVDVRVCSFSGTFRIVSSSTFTATSITVCEVVW